MERLTIDELISHCDRQLARLPSGNIMYQEHESVRAHLQILRHYVGTGTVDEFRAALRHIAEDDKAREEGRLIILPPSAKEGDPKPDCFEDYGGSLWCLGYQRSESDDEPCDRCKQCWYCESGDCADSQEAEAALGGGTHG